MATEQELKNTSPLHKEFQNLLDQDFKDRKLKENEIIKATIKEITKNFIVVDCKAKMEGMIPIEEFKNDDELAKLKVGSTIDVYLERIESARSGEIVLSRDKARKMKAWKKMEKVFETQEELTGYITGKVKGGFIFVDDVCWLPYAKSAKRESSGNYEANIKTFEKLLEIQFSNINKLNMEFSFHSCGMAKIIKTDSSELNEPKKIKKLFSLKTFILKIYKKYF